MKKNIGKYDRVIRIILGLVIIVLGIVFKTYLGLLGLIPLVTAVFNFCPIYASFKINTREKS